jgi:hypothetical protein
MRKKSFWSDRSFATPGSRKRRRLIAGWGIFFLAAIVLLGTTSFIQKAQAKSQVTPLASPGNRAAGDPVPAQAGLSPSGYLLGKLLPLDAPPPGAKQVTIGLYVNNVYELDPSSNTFFLSGYVWLRWRGDFDPVATLEFTNSVDDWGLTRTLVTEAPKVLPDGSNYQVIRIQGRFYQPFDLQNYPLDRQELALYVENNTETLDQVVYLPDNPSTGYGDTLLIPGWTIQGLDSSMFSHDYGTDFGETGVAEASKYATLKFSLEIERVESLFAWRLMLPLLIVLLTNWLALHIKPTFIDARTALPATALLTTVFLQQASLDAIPQVSTLVLMDKIYALVYVLIILTFIQIIWANFHLVEDDAASVARIRKIDAWSFGGQIAIFALALAFLVTSVH